MRLAVHKQYIDQIIEHTKPEQSDIDNLIYQKNKQAIELEIENSYNALLKQCKYPEKLDRSFSHLYHTKELYEALGIDMTIHKFTRTINRIAKEQSIIQYRETGYYMSNNIRFTQKYIICYHINDIPVLLQHLSKHIIEIDLTNEDYKKLNKILKEPVEDYIKNHLQDIIHSKHK